MTVPEGVKPGGAAREHAGRREGGSACRGATPGAVLAFTMPTGGTTTVDAAVKIQAIYRGKTARKGLVEEDAAEVQAAIKVQAITRGYTARFEIEEARRLEWFNYYKLPEVGEYDEALKLACTAEERAEVDAAQEASRVEWVRYYVATGNLSEAKRLLWDGKNRAPGAGWFRCCYNPARPPAGPIAPRSSERRSWRTTLPRPSASPPRLRRRRTSASRRHAPLPARPHAPRHCRPLHVASPSLPLSAALEWLSYYLAKRDFYEAENEAIIQSEKDLIGGGAGRDERRRRRRAAGAVERRRRSARKNGLR